jgi:zinc and cadmium transporter
MSVLGWIALYSGAIMAVSLFGGSVPLLGRVTHSRLQMYLSLSAGVMLGAAFFHVMPDAMKLAGDSFGWWVAFGVVGLFCIERFIAPHSHETSSKLQHEHEHEPGCEHDHEHRAAPPVAGWMAVIGLTLHTFINGVSLAGAVQGDYSEWVNGALVIPGLALFLAVILHKPADALAISTVLSRKGVSRRRLSLVQLGFASMIPVGALAFYWTSGKFQKNIENQMIGAALAFSAGTFLFIALSDLLPEVQFHRHDRGRLFLMLVLGVAAMGGIAYLEDLGGAHHHDEAGNRFITLRQEGSVVITVTGTVEDGKAKVGEIQVQDGDETHEYDALEKVPEEYRDKAQDLAELIERKSEHGHDHGHAGAGHDHDKAHKGQDKDGDRHDDHDKDHDKHGDKHDDHGKDHGPK